jgi:chromosome partitioning protein
MHNVRGSTQQGMTAGWSIYGEQLEPAIRSNIVDKLTPLNQVISWDDNNYRLGQIPNLHQSDPILFGGHKACF